MELSGSWWVIPIIILSVFMVMFGVIRAVMSCWKTVPPNSVAIVSGRSYKDGKGYKIIKGGGFFRIPVIERVDYVSLNLMSFPVKVENVPDKNGALLTVMGVANIKINSSEEYLPLAIERFLGKAEQEIMAVAKENLEGNLRSIVGNSVVESLISNRGDFQTRVLSEAGTDMAKLGLTVDLLNIQDIRDGKGYIESLGRKRTAEVIRDAAIGEAEAKRETEIKSAEARQLGAVATAAAEQKISDADRERDMVKASNQAQVEAALARVPIISQSAAAEEQKKLNVTEVAAAQARVDAEIGLQESVRKRTEAQLNATTIVQAEKEKEARIIGANATKEARIITATAEQEAAALEGEASRVKAEKEGQGEQAKMTAQALGRIEAARANQAEKEADAAGQKAQLLAQATGREAGLMAEARGSEAALMATANGRKALLLAEAEGTEKKAEAFAKLDEAGRFLLILEHLPAIIDSVGGAASKVIVPAAEAIGEGLGNIQELRLINMGGSAGVGGSNVLSDFMKAPPEAIFGLIQKLNAAGFGPMVKSIAAKAGIDIDNLMPDAGKIPGKTEVSEVPAPAEPTAPASRGKN